MTGRTGNRGRLPRTAASIALAFVAACFLLPLGWLVIEAFGAQRGGPSAPETALSLANFEAVLTPEKLFRPLANSLVLSTLTAVVTVAAALLAAYPLSRLRSTGMRRILYWLIFATGLPVTAIMVPVYAMFVQFHLLDSLPATALFMAAASLPTAVWMTKNFMDAVPRSLEEAAWVDGASTLEALRRVVVPLMRSGIGVVFVFVFLQAWGNFFVPFVLLFSPDMQTAAVSVFSFFGQYGTVAYGQLAAFSLLYSLPVLMLYVLVSGGTNNSLSSTGALKG